MTLKVLLPTELVLEAEVTKVSAEAPNGSFSLLPRHVDFVTALVPGLLSYQTPAGRQEYMAVDEGTLVKRGREVLVSTRTAVRGPDLGTLKDTVVRKLRELDDRERKARSALARLEADFVRQLLEMRDHARL
jgi:F-type H+-transporting ATPase subunit epsilon